MAKITDLINTKEVTFSFEVSPNISETEFDNLTMEPTFFSITWHAKSYQKNDLDIPPIRLAKLLRSKKRNVLLHLSCDLLTRDCLIKIIAILRDHDIRNLFIILGESYDCDKSEFKSSEELIKSIREETGEYFCIGVAGLPDCTDEKLLLLKNKVESGADFIITQAVFESQDYKTFFNRCKDVGINVPIIPGLFYFETYQQLNSFINLCKVKVSPSVLEYVNNKELTQGSSGIALTEKLIQSIINETKVNYFHFFTLDKLVKVSTMLKIIKF